MFKKIFITLLLLIACVMSAYKVIAATTEYTHNVILNSTDSSRYQTNTINLSSSASSPGQCKKKLC